MAEDRTEVHTVNPFAHCSTLPELAAEMKSKELDWARFHISEPDLTGLVEKVIELNAGVAAAQLITRYVISDWAEKRKKPSEFVSPELKPYALVSRDLGEKLVDLADRATQRSSPEYERVAVQEARTYFAAHPVPRE